MGISIVLKFIFILFISPQISQAQSCFDLFQNINFSDAELQNLFQQSLDISEKLAPGSKTDESQRNLYTRQLDFVYKKMVDLLTTTPPPVAPLYVYSQLVGEHLKPIRRWTTPIPYLNELQRSKMVLIKDSQGVYYEWNGSPLLTPINSLFVIGLDLKLYVFNSENEFENFKHSSFFGSVPVLFAGTIHLTPDGHILNMTRDSGHYRPSNAHSTWAKTYLESQGWIFATE